MNRTLAISLSLIAAAALPGAALATVVITDPTPLEGNQSWTYDLGQDFQVNSSVTVDALGAFTNSSTNTAPVEVALYKLTDANPADGGTLVTATVVTSGTTVGDYLLMPITAVTLAPGYYQLQSYGGSSDFNFNSGYTVTPDTNFTAFNTLGGALTEGTDFYGPGGAQIATSSDPHFYAAATFAVPEPASWALALLGFGLVGAGLRAQRRVLATA
jgi:hypothetical protein